MNFHCILLMLSFLCNYKSNENGFHAFFTILSKFKIDIIFFSELTNVNHTVLKTVTTFQNELKSMRLEVDKFQNESHDEMLKTMKNMSKDLNTELTDKITETKKNMSEDLTTELTNKMTETKKNMSEDLKTELTNKMRRQRGICPRT